MRCFTVAAGAGVLVILTGCVPTTSAPPVGDRSGELAHIREVQLDAQWSNLGFAEADRPPDTGFEVVAIEDWARRVAGCMTAAGYENFRAVGGTLQIGKSDPVSEPRAEAIDFFECRAAFQRDLGMDASLTVAQRDYLYDYYQETLVPCLELAGVRIDNAPTREQFAATGAGVGWNPYYALDTSSFGEVSVDGELLAQCPSFPKDPIFDAWRVIPNG